MAFSALLSWETPTTALRIRIVRICDIRLAIASVLEAMSTYDSWIDKRAPTAFIFKKSKNERDGSGTEQDDDKLVFELF